MGWENETEQERQKRYALEFIDELVPQIESTAHRFPSRQYRKMVKAFQEILAVPKEERYAFRNKKKFETLRDAAAAYVDKRENDGIGRDDYRLPNGKVVDKSHVSRQDYYDGSYTREATRLSFGDCLLSVGRDGVKYCELAKDDPEPAPVEEASKPGFFSSMWKAIAGFFSKVFGSGGKEKAPAAQAAETVPAEEKKQEDRTKKTARVITKEERESWLEEKEPGISQTVRTKENGAQPAASPRTAENGTKAGPENEQKTNVRTLV